MPTVILTILLSAHLLRQFTCTMATTQALEGYIVDDRYTVCKRLQSGFYGATWLATDARNDYQDVCLKTFFQESPAQEKELDVLKKLKDGHFSHENLCTVLDVCSAHAPVARRDGAVVMKAQYVVFEYCSGTDLFSFLVTGPFERRKQVSNFSEPLAAHYFTQASLAIIYLHERGVYHRDIKPENCVLDEHFNLKLTDFGTNKILPVSDDPTQVLRTKTKGIGTDNYRAPEVNAGLHSYDPSAADIWSLGVTLFFLIGIEEMVTKVKELDHYARSVLAPLGILFPFPLHCSKLDSYMKTAVELSSLTAPLPNELFWREWSPLSERMSQSLCDLFNRIFVLESSMRITMQEIVRHPWVSKATKLSPDSITRLMRERCPWDASPSAHAQPKALSGKKLGGVDQATLRQSLSRQGNNGQNPVVVDYLNDSELWFFTDALRQLEAVQLSIIKNDIQGLIIDLNLVRQLLKEILAAPHKEENRTVNLSVLASSWMTSFLCTLGFLPQAKLIYLPPDHLNLMLLSTALAIIDGVELAVTRGAIHVESSPEGSDVEEDEEMVTDMTTFTPPQDTIPVSSVDSGYEASRQLQSQDSQMDTMSTTPTYSSSQDSGGMCWAQYSTGGSISQQSSQEECPEAMIELGGADMARSHALLTLHKCVDTRTPKPAYRAASEFCKLSGLLCSYGLYQVVISEQLCLYCRGNTSSFSARVVLVDQESGAIGISSWCFAGPEEWVAILERADHDMNPQQTQ